MEHNQRTFEEVTFQAKICLRERPEKIAKHN